MPRESRKEDGLEIIRSQRPKGWMVRVIHLDSGLWAQAWSPPENIEMEALEKRARRNLSYRLQDEGYEQASLEV